MQGPAIIYLGGGSGEQLHTVEIDAPKDRDTQPRNGSGAREIGRDKSSLPVMSFSARTCPIRSQQA